MGALLQEIDHGCKRGIRGRQVDDLIEFDDAEMVSAGTSNVASFISNPYPPDRSSSRNVRFRAGLLVLWGVIRGRGDVDV